MAFVRKFLNRGDKADVLNEDLEQIDRRINHMKTACHSTHKKIQASLRDVGQDKDKRMKKLPEAQVAMQMKDASVNLGQDSLMGNLFHLCGEAECNVADRLVDCEIEIESRVLAPLHTLSEQQIPSILKKKKVLEDSVYHYENARKKYTSTSDRHSQMPGGNIKIENAKEEMEDAQNKVELCKDQLSTEMFSFSAKEAENSAFLLEYIKIQAEYHKEALKALQDAIPKMKDACEQHNQVPVYGTSLEEHLRRTNREISFVIDICVAILVEDALREEGLFRIAGAANKVKKVKAALDAGLAPDMNEIRDIHCIAGALKLYLRELPEPLLTYKLYNEWMDAAHLQHEEKLQSLWLLCERLPKPNYNNLRHLIKFLAKLSEMQDINKMTPSNIAIVIGPNLLWQQDVGQSVLTTSSQSAIVEALISHSEYFFPGEVDFWSGNMSDKSRDSDTTDPFLPQPTPNHDSLTKSASGSNLLSEVQNQDFSSPRMVRKEKTKKPAPLPPNIERPAPPPPTHSTAGPGSTTSLDRHQITGSNTNIVSTGSLERRERPPTADKPLNVVTQISGGDKLVTIEKSPITPPDRPPLPDRPSLGPPPAPPTKQDNAALPL